MTDYPDGNDETDDDSPFSAPQDQDGPSDPLDDDLVGGDLRDDDELAAFDDGFDDELDSEPTAGFDQDPETDLDPEAGTGPADEPGPEPTPDPVLEMRQVAGLTSGSVMELHVGSFQFHESESDVGFAVVIDESEEAYVVPGSAQAQVDEVPLHEPTPLFDSILNVGSACFTVRRHRPTPDNDNRLRALEEIRRGPGAITVPDLTVTEGGPTQNRSSRFGALFSRSAGESETLDHRWWEFLESVREARSLVAERHRWLHPDPEELRSRLSRLDPGLWDRTRRHPQFGRIALAYATIPWEPRFDDPDRIPTELHGLIREMSKLPWVPVTANLALGPLGIVGPRAAALAATRHAVLTLACLTAPSDLSFSIVTAKGLIDSWSWTSALPNSLFADGRPNAFPIAIADGMVHFEGAGLAHEAVLNNEMGLIALAESVDELPDYCATILHISPDGRCMVTNHMGEQVPGTPIGVTASFAASMAASLTEVIGDDEVLAEETRPAAPPPERPRRAAEPTEATVDDHDDEPDLDAIHEEVQRATSDIQADEFADELGEMLSPPADS